MKKDIAQVIIVEGKTDSARLSSFYNVDTIETGGSAIGDSIITLIKSVAAHREIIVFTDSDYAGERIRKIVCNLVPNSHQAFIDKDKFKTAQVAHASKEAIESALTLKVKFDKKTRSLVWNDYNDLLSGNKSLRNNVALHFHLPMSNNKTLFNRLNMIGVDIKLLKEVIRNYEIRNS